MDYFAVGSTPVFSFPPHLPQSFGPKLQECSFARHGDITDRPAESFALEGLEEGGAEVPSPQPTPLGPSAPAADLAQSHVIEEPPVKAPKALHRGFDLKQVRPWDPSRFELIKKLQDATRNSGQVHLMRDTGEGRLFAVKQMPNRWICKCHTDFAVEHPGETEMPWQDVGCLQFLNSVSFEYACELVGVFRDNRHTYVVTSFASEGDLFSWCEAGVPPSLEREVVVQPLARQMMEGMQRLHDLSIIHRDVSMENILLSKSEDDTLRIRIIDFSMSTTTRRSRHCVRGKSSYQAPELHTDTEYDSFLTDVFSLGVTLYAIILKDYPWLSTRPGGCKCFDYVRRHGLRAYLAKRKLRNSTVKAAEVMSEPLKQLLEGMLALDPAHRLTLGESVWASEGERRSVWDEPWVHDSPGTV